MGYKLVLCHLDTLHQRLTRDFILYKALPGLPRAWLWALNSPNTRHALNAAVQALDSSGTRQLRGVVMAGGRQGWMSAPCVWWNTCCEPGRVRWWFWWSIACICWHRLQSHIGPSTWFCGSEQPHESQLWCQGGGRCTGCMMSPWHVVWQVCCFVTLSLCCHSAVNALLWAGSISWIGHPNSFWAGNSLSLLEGVLRYCSRAQARWFSSIACPFHAPQISFFINFTVASALPLLCGYRGDDVMCWKPHCCANLWRLWR